MFLIAALENKEKLLKIQLILVMVNVTIDSNLAVEKYPNLLTWWRATTPGKIPHKTFRQDSNKQKSLHHWNSPHIISFLSYYRLLTLAVLCCVGLLWGFPPLLLWSPSFLQTTYYEKNMHLVLEYGIQHNIMRI